MPCIFGLCDVEIKYECRLELDLSIMDLNYKELLQIAIKATVLAGNEVLKQYEEGFETIIKADGSPVTTADLAANDILTEHLNKTGIAIISEEGAWYDHTFRQAHPYWCLDPIDGTRDFVDRTDEFCVSVGLIAENTSKIGILYAPALHLFYFAAEGVGSFKFIGSVNEMTQLVSYDGFLDAFMQSSERLPIDKSPNENLFMASRFHRSPNRRRRPSPNGHLSAASPALGRRPRCRGARRCACSRPGGTPGRRGSTSCSGPWPSQSQTVCRSAVVKLPVRWKSKA